MTQYIFKALYVGEMPNQGDELNQSFIIKIPLALQHCYNIGVYYESGAKDIGCPDVEAFCSETNTLPIDTFRCYAERFNKLNLGLNLYESAAWQFYNSPWIRNKERVVLEPIEYVQIWLTIANFGVSLNKERGRLSLLDGINSQPMYIGGAGLISPRDFINTGH